MYTRGIASTDSYCAPLAMASARETTPAALAADESESGWPYLEDTGVWHLLEPSIL